MGLVNFGRVSWGDLKPFLKKTTLDAEIVLPLSPQITRIIKDAFVMAPNNPLVDATFG